MRRAAGRPIAVVLAALLTGACTGGLPSTSVAVSQRPSAAQPLLTAGDIPVPPDAQQAVVVAVSDGDTVRLRGLGTGPVPGASARQASTRVRILLVDAPEVSGAPQCFGPEATRRTAQLLPVGTVVRVAGDVQTRDRFGRPLLHLWRPDGVHVGEQLVAEGFVRVLQLEPNRRYVEVLRQREQQARAARRGLWGACGQEPPSGAGARLR